MNRLRYIFYNIVETLLRVSPIPCKTGLIKIGRPDRNSPVFLTGNFHLTVERVKKALEGIDCYLLVANSRGYNVWCAATGGHLTNHDVISALMVTGIEDLVDHKNVILPQLAATGIENKVILKKTGWRVTWGPVYAKDIPAFLANRSETNPEMRKVKFPLVQRIEMATMWAFPFSVIVALIMLPFWHKMILPVTTLIWAFPFFIFLFFPLYARWLNPKRKGISLSRYTIIFDIGRVPLILWSLFLCALIAYSYAAGTSEGFILRWGVVSFIVVLVVSLDLMGSTPTFKSGLHEDRFLKIVLDEDKCKGAGFCEQVCPRSCYEVDHERHKATMPRADLCVQCGACIVQCPFDALYFKSPDGEVIPPDATRKFKLNLMGKRLVKVK